MRRSTGKLAVTRSRRRRRTMSRRRMMFGVRGEEGRLRREGSCEAQGQCWPIRCGAAFPFIHLDERRHERRPSC
jgi:hypothetical protein